MVITLLSEEEQKIIVNQYYTSTSTKLAKEFGVSKSLITKVWSENGMRGKTNRKYYADFNYFRDIDTKDKAYYIGFIAADGCVYKRDLEGNTHMNSAQGLLTITVSETDREILDKLKIQMHSSHPINIGKQRGNIQSTATLSIVSDTLVNDLGRYNVTPRKTWTYSPVGIPDELMCHFIRGYFDGDGSIFHSNKNDRLCDYSACIVGNNSTLSFVHNELVKVGINLSLKEDKRQYKGGKFYALRTKNKKDLYLFLKYLYDDCDELYLNRKREKALSYMRRYEKE